jgi:hypothetical protein
LNLKSAAAKREGKYDRDVLVAQKALEVAEQNVGENHSEVATTLNNPATLHQATERSSGAAALEQRQSENKRARNDPARSISAELKDLSRR